MLVIAPTATGKTGSSIRTLGKRGGAFFDFHLLGRGSFAQFARNESFVSLVGNIKKSGNPQTAYMFGHIYTWVIAHMLWLRKLVDAYPPTRTAPPSGVARLVPTLSGEDLVRAQLNGNRRTINLIYIALTD